MHVEQAIEFPCALLCSIQRDVQWRPLDRLLEPIKELQNKNAAREVNKGGGRNATRGRKKDMMDRIDTIRNHQINLDCGDRRFS
jgi:hypothetical protein